LKSDDDVESWLVCLRLLGPGALSFIRSIDVFTPPGLLFKVDVRELSVGLKELMVVFWSLSAGRRRESASEDLRFGGNKGRFDGAGLASPEIEASRSPICE
jgi:hypothetical protein